MQEPPKPKTNNPALIKKSQPSSTIKKPNNEKHSTATVCQNNREPQIYKTSNKMSSNSIKGK